MTCSPARKPPTAPRWDRPRCSRDGPWRLWATIHPRWTRSVKKEVVQSLIHDHAFAIFVCAKHLSDLRDLFFPAHGADDLSDDDLVMLGARYDHGPDQSDETVRKDLSYGRRIIGRRAVLARLLTDTPVKEPDWKSP